MLEFGMPTLMLFCTLNDASFFTLNKAIVA